MNRSGAWAVAMVCLLALPAGANWMWADAAGKAPSFPPGSLFWMTNKFRTAPTLFRTTITVRDEPVACAAVRAAAPACVFVYLNGKLVGEAKAEGERNAEVRVDLTPALRPGPNVLVVSTSADGCALAGGIAYDDDRFQPVATPEAWRVRKFAPLTMLTHLDCMKPGFDDGGWPSVQPAAEPFSFERGEVEAFCATAELARLGDNLDECEWRLKLLLQKGIVLMDWEAFGWAGPQRLPRAAVEAAQSLLAQVPSARDALNGSDPAPARRLVDGTDACSLCVWVTDETNNLANHLTAYRIAGDETKGVALRQAARFARQRLPHIEAVLAADEYATALKLSTLCRERILQAKSGGVLNDLNQCLDNPFGWFDCPELLDNDIANWGLRVNPPRTSWQVNLDGKWRFKTDPQNTGLDEGRQTFAYNLDNHWRELQAPGSWESQGVHDANPDAVAQSPYPGVNERTDGPYNGWAWYRKTVKVPREWSGHDLELLIGRVDDWDWVYFNGEEIGHTGADTEGWWHVPRAYKVPRDAVKFGQHNTIALRIYDCGAEGVVGSVELRCPALKAAYEAKADEAAPPVDVLASPLSPASLLTVPGGALSLSGWEDRGLPGPQVLVLPLAADVQTRAIRQSGVLYDAATDGRLAENWMLLWTDVGEQREDVPILIVLLQAPRRVEADRSSQATQRVLVTFGRRGAQALVLRPFRERVNLPGDSVPDEILSRCRFWASALLAYPVSFTETIRRDPSRNGSLLVTDVYNYRILKDDWNTPAHKLAPVPPLLSYALRLDYPGVALVRGTATDLQYPLDPPLLPGGTWGRHQAIVNADVLQYRIPAPRFKRNGGFTSFCFSPVDIGMPGNIKELETIKVAGANSYRPQHNQHGDLARKMVQMCLDAGLNHVFNVDNRLGASDEVFEHYRILAEMCKDMPADMIAYDLINEPANMAPDVYNPRVKKLTEIIRGIDSRHLIYVETPHSYASVRQFPNLEPTGDPLTVYSFHDYKFRLPPRWPNEKNDARDILRHWIPAFRYAAENRTPIHLGEFGGFEQTKNDPFGNPCTVTMMLDYLKLFDHFGWHFHYYANRGIVRVREDGSLQESLVQDAYRRYFATGRFNAFAPEGR